VTEQLKQLKQLAASLQDKCVSLIAERDELKLAYAECSRQKNELLTAHKVNARREVDDEALMREALNCGATEYERMADLRVRIRARLEGTDATEAKHL